MSGTLTCIPSVLRKEQGLELGMFVLQRTGKLEGEGAKEIQCSFWLQLCGYLILLTLPRKGGKYCYPFYQQHRDSMTKKQGHWKRSPDPQSLSSGFVLISAFFWNWQQKPETLTEPSLLIPYSHYSSSSFMLEACRRHYFIQCCISYNSYTMCCLVKNCTGALRETFLLVFFVVFFYIFLFY